MKSEAMYREVPQPTDSELEDMHEWYLHQEQQMKEMELTNLFWKVMTMISTCSMMLVACATSNPWIIVPAVGIQVFCLNMERRTTP